MTDQPEAVELAHADVEQAQNAMVVATGEASNAEEALAAAQAELMAVKKDFVAAPTPEGDAAVELAEKNLRSAERLAEARTFQTRSAEDLLAAAERIKAEHELDVAGAQREQLRADLKVKLDELRTYYDRASIAVAELESLVSRDQQICAAASDAQKRAKVAGSIRPIELDTLRRAAQIMLGSGRPRPRSQATQDPAMDRVLSDLGREPRPNADEKAILLELALLEHARVSEAPTGLWLTPAYALPQFLNATASAASYAQAARLLAALQGAQK